MDYATRRRCKDGTLASLANSASLLAYAAARLATRPLQCVMNAARSTADNAGLKSLAALMLGCLCLALAAAPATAAVTTTLEGEFAISPTDEGDYSTPAVTFNGKIYVAFINPSQQTVVGQKANGVWTFSVIEPYTMNDPEATYHAAPSIAVDRNGYIHVLYNVHNTPWQYKVSTRPEDITSWEFRGQYAGTKPSGYGVGDPGSAGCSGTCATNWMGPGIAAIPGNQITYPFMTTDRNGVIYVAYRECYYCDRSDPFTREYSAGIAKYDVSTKTWSRVGNTRPFAHDSAYLAQGMHLFFDKNNRMHVSWIWGRQYTSSNGSGAFYYNPSYPSYAYSDDGGQSFYRTDGQRLTLPLNLSQSEKILDPAWVNPSSNGYFLDATEVTAGPDGRPYVVVYPLTTSSTVNRAYVTRTSTGWTKPVLMPYSAFLLLVDTNGMQTAVSSGLNLHRRSSDTVSWTTTGVDTANGPFRPRPDYSYFNQTNQLRVLGQKFWNTNNYYMRLWTVNFSDTTPPPTQSSQLCSPNVTQSCAVVNGTGKQTCSADGTTWGSCQATSCNTGYTLTNGACVAQTTTTTTPTTTTTTTTTDKTPPSVVLTNPTNGQTVWPGTTVRIWASASDNVALKQVEFYINGTLKCTVPAGNPYYCSWLIPSPRSTTYSLQARAIDTSGNATWSTIFRVTSAP